MKLFLWPCKLRGTILLISFLLFGIGLLALYWGRDEVYVGVLYHFSMAPLYYVYCLWQFYLTDRLFALRRFTLFWPALLCSMIGLSALIYGITHLAPGYSHQFDFFSHFAGALFLGAFAAILRAAKQKMSKEAELAAYRAASNEAEIKLLKQQVNPHFLFNTLNSIYLKCIENKDEAGEMVQLLADLLRYQLEQGNQQTVTIGEEIGFVENYIFFEKRRLSANVAFVFEQSIDNAGQTIAPNLLITLVENAFKHGVRVGMSSAIRISVQLKGRLLQMVTVNTCLLASEPQRRGTGLNNLAHRLAYLYPNRHQLDLAAENGFFKATLMIEL